VVDLTRGSGVLARQRTSQDATTPGFEYQGRQPQVRDEEVTK
jgi:hypothetical protein